MKQKGCLLVVDDNKNVLMAVRMLMQNHFSEVVTLASPQQIPSILREKMPDVVLLDMNFTTSINSGNEGLYWLREIKKLKPDTNVVLFTAYADVNLAVNGMKDGAIDFVVKPFDNDNLVEVLTQARDGKEKNTSKEKKESVSDKDRSQMFWGESPAMVKLRHVVERIAKTDANVLITGENGTGKELLAREIHRLSLRHNGPMVAVDMGALTETLFESELFGHVKGAFTDAKSDRAGKFEEAENGTLFMDEIGNLSYQLQAKLLRALQQRYITRVGGNKQIDVNIRLVCATNKNLQEMVGLGEFREDLLYRINTIHLEIPSLRERKEDIPALVELFLGKYGKMYNAEGLQLSQDAKEKLMNTPWMGNIRELEHVVEKAVIMSDHQILTANDFDTPNVAEKAERDTRTGDKELFITGQTLEDMEKNMIKQAMVQCEGNLSLVAQQLGISRQTLYNKLKRYGL